MTSLAERIRGIGEPMIARGCTPAEVRAEVFRQLGFTIGGGGGGGRFGDGPLPDPCGYCGQTGNGGHGGMCPNA
jgi:hypothetical protein